jgi:hypothetical protein
MRQTRKSWWFLGVVVGPCDNVCFDNCTVQKVEGLLERAPEGVAWLILCMELQCFRALAL